MPSVHSEFGASSAARYLACPGALMTSRRAIERGLGRKGGSVYADEGTAGHLLAEMCRATGRHPHDYVGHTIKLDSGNEFEVTFDFADAVAVFTDHTEVLTQLGYEVWLEQTVEPAWAWTGSFEKTQDAELPFDLFGTADVIAYHPELFHLVIVDLKFGRGIVVEVGDNAQLLYYGTGALGKFTKTRRVDNVSMRIVQPRAAHPDGPVREMQRTPEQLVGWARKVLKPGIMRALEPDGELIAGEHCRFCPAVTDCPEAKNALLNTAIKAYDDVPEEFDLDAVLELDKDTVKKRVALSPTVELDRLWGQAQVAKMVINAVEEALKSRLETASADDADDLLFSKPVSTADREQWNDKVDVDDVVGLITNAFDETGEVTTPISKAHDVLEEIIDGDPHMPTLAKAAKTPKAVRRILKQYDLPTNLLDRYVVKVPGRLTLAPATDPRPRLLPAVDEDISDVI